MFRLTERDCLIIKAVNDCRALTTAQVQTLFFTSPSPTYTRLQKLFHHGYLERHFITQVAAAPAASPIVYTVTALGGAVLTANFNYTAEDIHPVTRQVLNWQTLQHLLAVNEARVVLTRACQEQGVTLLTWLDEFTFRAHPDTVWVGSDTGKQSKKPVLPDGYFRLKTLRGEAAFFLEVDRGTEGSPQFKSQIEIYQAYILGGGYQERFKSRSLRILTVTTGVRRLANLSKAVVQVGGADRYWFTTQGQITPAQILTAPIWQVVGREGVYPLIG